MVSNIKNRNGVASYTITGRFTQRNSNLSGLLF